MYINLIIIRLHLLILSPVFSSLLTFILLIVYKVYFEPAILCDDGSSPLLLVQLKSNLIVAMERSTLINENIIGFNEDVQEMERNLGKLSSARKKFNKEVILG